MKPKRNIVIFGASSAIAESIAKTYADNPYYQTSFYLVARNLEKLQPIIKDLQVRGAHEVANEIINLDDCSTHLKIINNAKNFFNGDVDIGLIAQGVLPTQEKLDKDVDLAMANFHSNATSVISIMMHLANLFAEQNFGRMAVIGSVAGDRGRAVMNTYGAAKAAVDRTAEALSGRFFNSAVSITLIKPGLTATPMTAHLNQKGFLWSSADEVAKCSVSAIDNKKSVAYTPWKWKIIMLIVIHLPSYFINKFKI